MSTSAYDTRSGWVTFAAIMMFAVGFARIISAITYFDDSNDVTTSRRASSATASGPGASGIS